jgi:hypothetical protein
MVEHICKICNLKTNQKCDYDKHLLTKKHINNIINKKNNSESTFCEYCNFKAKQKSDYTKHLLTKKHIYNISKNNNTVNNNTVNNNTVSNNTVNITKNSIDNSGNLINKIDNLAKQNEEVLKQNEELKKKIEKLEKVSNENTHKIVKEARVIKKSILSVLNNDFKDTPSIDYIKEDEFRKEFEEEYNLKLDDMNNKIFMRIFSDFQKRKLITSLCNVIVRIIKNEDQKKQSVFNIDASRGNYATKIQNIWYNDKKGLQFKKYTIDVVTKYMINIMDIYRERLIDTYNENKIKNNVEVSDYIMEYRVLLLDMDDFLTNPNTHKKIIIQLCPELRFDENLLE